MSFREEIFHYSRHRVPIRSGQGEYLAVEFSFSSIRVRSAWTVALKKVVEDRGKEQEIPRAGVMGLVGGYFNALSVIIFPLTRPAGETTRFATPSISLNWRRPSSGLSLLKWYTVRISFRFPREADGKIVE